MKTAIAININRHKMLTVNIKKRDVSFVVHSNFQLHYETFFCIEFMLSRMFKFEEQAHNEI